jgi:hypothetical protein
MLDLNTTKQVNEKGFKPKLVNPTTHTITIGRNVGNKPLPNHKWQGFQSAIISFIERHNSIIYVHSLGVGIWEGINKPLKWGFLGIKTKGKKHE